MFIIDQLYCYRILLLAYIFFSPNLPFVNTWKVKCPHKLDRELLQLCLTSQDVGFSYC